MRHMADCKLPRKESKIAIYIILIYTTLAMCVSYRAKTYKGITLG